MRESGDSIEGEREKSRDAAKPFCREQIAKLMVIRIFYGSYIYEKVQEGVKMIGFDHRRWRYSVAYALFDTVRYGRDYGWFW